MYTATYLDPGLDKSTIMTQQDRCDHSADIKCSFNLNDCYLKRFGFAIAMHTLGDKYDIPGLRDYSCTYYEKLFGHIKQRHWPLHLAIWKMAYEHSRHSDDLRKALFNQVRLGLSSQLRDFLLKDPVFRIFLDQSPELGLPLLKVELGIRSEDVTMWIH